MYRCTCHHIVSHLCPLFTRMSCFDMCVQALSVPVVWLKPCSMSHMGREMERNWMSTFPAPTLWVQTHVAAMTPAHHPVVMLQICRNMDNVCKNEQALFPLFQMSTLLFTYMEATGSFSGRVWSPLLCNADFPVLLFHVIVFNALYLHSKEESGFMAVPLVDKGVVVVAVDYDTAPKGRVF